MASLFLASVLDILPAAAPAAVLVLPPAAAATAGLLLLWLVMAPGFSSWELGLTDTRPALPPPLLLAGEEEELVVVPGWSCAIHMLQTLPWISSSVCHLCDVEVGELLSHNSHLILAGSLGPLGLGGGARLASHYRGRGVPEHMRNVF